MIVRGASWCDLVTYPDGRVELVYLVGSTVACAQRWVVDAGQPLLYLRAAADGDGRVLALGQGHNDGQAYAVIEGGAPFFLGPTHGVFPVLVGGRDEGWVCFVQHRPDAYMRIVLDADGWELERTVVTMALTSQGFLYLSAAGQPVTQDAGRHVIPGLALPSPAADVWAGQSTTDATIALYDAASGRIIPLGTKGGQPPHIVERAGVFYVCSYTGDDAWMEALRRPFAVVEPPVEPPIDPPKEPDVSVRDVPILIRVIEQVKNDFPTAWRNCHRPDVSRDQAEEFARRAAWACSLADARFGLNGKRGDPNTISQDCVCFKHDDGRESVIDFGGGAGGDNPTVQWSIVGHYQVPGPPLQLWIRAERVGGGSTNPPPPPPSGFTFPTGTEMPEDVSLSIIDGYLPGIRERDKIRGESDTVPSRGALMYLQTVTFRELSSWIVQKKRAPIGVEWWAVRDRIVAAAVKYYQDRQGVD